MSASTCRFAADSTCSRRVSFCILSAGRISRGISTGTPRILIVFFEMLIKNRIRIEDSCKSSWFLGGC
jgi:hypothetical protein